jgi:hypothetical protein
MPTWNNSPMAVTAGLSPLESNTSVMSAPMREAACACPYTRRPNKMLSWSELAAL